MVDREKTYTYSYSIYQYQQHFMLPATARCKITGETDTRFRIRLLEGTNKHLAGDELWVKKTKIKRENNETEKITDFADDDTPWWMRD